ncbi:MAG TPA: glycosyltransferase [Opitutaceae bacterium]|nr:glycosyltransferase [Opitutaceae bacterium]
MGLSRSAPTIAYLFTTFPKPTETFLQREIIAMQRRGVQLRLYSLWGGGGEFHGLKVESFNKWELLRLFWIIPFVGVTRWDVLGELIRGLFTRRAPSWINFWENMLGAGFAGCYYKRFRADRPTWVHAAWAGAPATAAYLLGKMNGHRYSSGAHAYDIYEHGGDWWLREKLAPAQFVHTSTDMGRETLISYGIAPEKIHCIRRGLEVFPTLNPLRPNRSPLRIVCVARLVEKKGLRHQLKIYSALSAAGLPFEVRLIGDGPLRGDLEKMTRDLRLSSQVRFVGHLKLTEVWQQLAWADVLVHSGIIAPSGDRDGLPNVIPEAMSAGVLVITSPVAATTEAIQHGVTGQVAEVTDIAAWLDAFRRYASDDVFAESIRMAARAWVEENFDAHKNAARLFQLFEDALVK